MVNLFLINASLVVTLKDLNGNPLSEEQEENVLQLLMDEKLAADLPKKQIVDWTTLEIKYLFEFQVGEYTEMEFAPIDEDED